MADTAQPEETPAVDVEVEADGERGPENEVEGSEEVCPGMQRGG